MLWEGGGRRNALGGRVSVLRCKLLVSSGVIDLVLVDSFANMMGRYT